MLLHDKWYHVTVFDEVVGAKFVAVGSEHEDSQPTSDGSC